MVDIWKVVRLEVERPGPRHLSLKFVALQSHSKGPNDHLPIQRSFSTATRQIPPVVPVVIYSYHNTLT